MCVKHNAFDFTLKYLLASRMVNESFYIDDGLTGVDSVEGPTRLAFYFANGIQVNTLFLNISSLNFETLTMPDPSEYNKMLKIELNAGMDHFHLTIADLPRFDNLTKRAFVSDIVKTFDILGWYSLYN